MVSKKKKEKKDKRDATKQGRISSSDFREKHFDAKKSAILWSGKKERVVTI